MYTCHYQVKGLVNSESKTKLNNALDKIEGVQKTAVDIARGTVNSVRQGTRTFTLKKLECLKQASA